MKPPYLLLDIDGVLIPFPTGDGGTPPNHALHDVVPADRSPEEPTSPG